MSLRWIRSTLRSVSSRPNTTQSTVSAARGYSYWCISGPLFPIATNARSSASSRSKPPDRIGNRHHDRGSRFWSSRWKRRRVAARASTGSAPQAEEPLDPRRELRRRVVRDNAASSSCSTSSGRALVADRRVLDGVEQIVRHQVGLVGLRPPPAAGRSSAVGCCALIAASAGNGREPDRALGAPSSAATCAGRPCRCRRAARGRPRCRRPSSRSRPPPRSGSTW